MAASIFDGIDRAVAPPLDLDRIATRPLTEDELIKLCERALEMRPRPPMTEAELVSRLSAKNQRAYANLRFVKRRQFRWLRKELFRRTVR